MLILIEKNKHLILVEQISTSHTDKNMNFFRICKFLFLKIWCNAKRTKTFPRIIPKYEHTIGHVTSV